MFINNWYAACIADRLGAEPMRVRMLDCEFVLFRDSSGTARCLSDSCCHRGASLAAGQYRDGTRGDPVMTAQAAMIGEDDVALLARYFAGLEGLETTKPD